MVVESILCDTFSPLTMVASGVAPAVQTLPRTRVALLAVPVTEAGLALWETPVVGFTVGTLAPICPWHTQTLPSGGVAGRVLRAQRVTFTRCRERIGQFLIVWVLYYLVQVIHFKIIIL